MYEYECVRVYVCLYICCMGMCAYVYEIVSTSVSVCVSAYVLLCVWGICVRSMCDYVCGNTWECVLVYMC